MNGRGAALIVALLALAAPAAAESFELANGDKVTGEVVERTSESIVLEHPVFGRIELPVSALDSETANPGLFGTDFMKGWTRVFGLGLNGSEGNTVNFNLRSFFDFDYADERRRWEADGAIVYVADDDETTDRNARVTLRHDWLFPESRWYVFATGVYDYDDFKDWRHRLAGVSGPGYEILQRESLHLRSAVGLSFQREFSGEKENIFGGYWGVEFEWRINSRLRFRAKNQLFPYFTEVGEYRNLSNLGLRIQLTESPVLNLDMGMENEYDSNAVPEDHKNDLRYFSTIGLEF